MRQQASLDAANQVDPLVELRRLISPILDQFVVGQDALRHRDDARDVRVMAQHFLAVGGDVAGDFIAGVVKMSGNGSCPQGVAIAANADDGRAAICASCAPRFGLPGALRRLAQHQQKRILVALVARLVFDQ